MKLQGGEKRQIKITSRITDAEGQVTELIQVTEATYKRSIGKSFLLYNEGEIGGMTDTKTLLSYDGSILTVKRYGEVNSNLRIETNQMHENIYQTPYGNFIMQTKGGPINWQDDERIEIFMDYNLQLEGESDHSEVSIQIIEAES